MSERMPVLDALLADSAHSMGNIEIVTSAISIAEVAFHPLEKQANQLNDDYYEKISSLWVPGGAIRVVEFYQAIGEEARDLIRYCVSNGIKSVKPPDAIHLATAMALEATEFHTYNVKDYTQLVAYVGLQIHEPKTASSPQLNLPSSDT